MNEYLTILTTGSMLSLFAHFMVYFFLALDNGRPLSPFTDEGEAIAKGQHNFFHTRVARNKIIKGA